MFGEGSPGDETLGSCWGKDETTRFQNDAVRDDLRLGAEGKQVVEQLGREGPEGRGRKEGGLCSESADFEVGRKLGRDPRSEGRGWGSGGPHSSLRIIVRQQM